MPSVQPGYLHDLLPRDIPAESENWRDVMTDMEKYIMPGMTHWQSPNFHAYYPTQTSYPSIVGDMIISALGVVGFSWICSPACTELEVVMMDWVGKFLNIPEEFLPSGPGNGGGVIQGSASEAILIALLAAREQTVLRVQKENPLMTESEIRGKLIAYGNIHANSAVEKAGLLGAMKMRLLEADENSVLRGATLKRQVEEDIAAGLIPTICVATMGTTGICAYDDMEELGPVCQEHKIWFHVDGAYAAGAMCLPEYSHISKGLHYADSFNFNLHKWMLVNFDCTAMWVKDANLLTNSFNVDRIYLSHQFQGQSRAPDYRHWQLALGRRFRSLKVWITLRTYGQEKIREFLRSHINLAKRFENLVKADERFEVKRTELGLVCFRMKGECSRTKKMLEILTDNKKIYLIPATYREELIARFVICGFDPKEGDIDFAWEQIKEAAEKVLGTNKMITSELETMTKTDVEKVSDKITSALLITPDSEKTKN